MAGRVTFARRAALLFLLALLALPLVAVADEDAEPEMTQEEVDHMYRQIHFDQFDSDGDGELDDQEIVEMFRKGEAASEAEGAAEEMMAELDADEDGTISFAEFFKEVSEGGIGPSSFGPKGAAPSENDDDATTDKSRLLKTKEAKGKAPVMSAADKAKVEKAKQTKREAFEKKLPSPSARPSVYHGEAPSRPPAPQANSAKVAAVAKEASDDGGGSCGTEAPTDKGQPSCGGPTHDKAEEEATVQIGKENLMDKAAGGEGGGEEEEELSEEEATLQWQQKQFEKYDTDSDGELDAEEITKMLLQGEAASEAHAAGEEMLADLDQDETGSLSFEEWTRSVTDRRK